MRAVASNRDVIDPKYDSCTKPSARQRFKKILATDIRRRGIRASVFSNQRTPTERRRSCNQFISVMFDR